MNTDKYDQRIQLTRAPVEGKQLKGKKSGYDLHQHEDEHGHSGAGRHSDVQQHVLPSNESNNIYQKETDHYLTD